MLSVTANKLSAKASKEQHRCYTGYLMAMPVVGRGLVIFRDPHGHRMITTPVRRVLKDTDGPNLYVETDNSVYRLEIHGSPVFANGTIPVQDKADSPPLRQHT